MPKYLYASMFTSHPSCTQNINSGLETVCTD